MNEILHGDNFKSSKSDSEDESEDEIEMNDSLPFSHQLGFNLKSVSHFSDGKPIGSHLQQEMSTPIDVQYPQPIRSNLPAQMESLRPSALSSRLGFNMDLLNKFHSTAKYEPSANYQHQPQQVHQPEQQVNNRFQTYSDIDMLDSELYRIGPPPSTSFSHDSASNMTDDDSMSMGEECKQLSSKVIFCPNGNGDGDSKHAINVEDMLAFLEHL
mmetsp:Transcript_34297/g.49842  ORF Transcript_34297/g.49842 Transcript_34297/m.49842 type:complete len:213 (+) Transcript_34297:415-1053(+)